MVISVLVEQSKVGGDVVLQLSVVFVEVLIRNDGSDIFAELDYMLTELIKDFNVVMHTHEHI